MQNAAGFQPSTNEVDCLPSDFVMSRNRFYFEKDDELEKGELAVLLSLRSRSRLISLLGAIQLAALPIPMLMERCEGCLWRGNDGRL